MRECLSCDDPETLKSAPWCDACLARHQAEYMAEYEASLPDA